MRAIWTTLGALALASMGWGGWSLVHVRDGAASAKRAANPADERQREILKLNLGLSGDPELDAMFAGINAAHFQGSLPVVPVRWERRLAEVGALEKPTFTLAGMFGHIGPRTVILLNPALQSDPGAIERALCHEMVHAYLYAHGDTSTDHGATFQAVLRRLSEEGAFEGVVADENERASLKGWLDQESARLDAERHEIESLAADAERERLELERDQAALTARLNAAGATGAGRPDRREIEALDRRRDAYNQRAMEGSARAEQQRAAADAFDREVRRYNLMLVVQ